MDDSDNQEILDALDEPNLSGSFARKLAWAIVRAHPCSKVSSEKTRVNNALKALLGDTHNADRHKLATTEALIWMADEYISDRGGHSLSLNSKDPFAHLNKSHEDDPSGRVRDNKTLAILASKNIKNSPTPRHLENEFCKVREPLCKARLLETDVPSLLHQQTLSSLKEKLSLYGIKLAIGGK